MLPQQLSYADLMEIAERNRETLDKLAGALGVSPGTFKTMIRAGEVTWVDAIEALLAPKIWLSCSAAPPKSDAWVLVRRIPDEWEAAIAADSFLATPWAGRFKSGRWDWPVGNPGYLIPHRAELHRLEWSEIP
jgi:hypothetical protein